MRNGRAHQARSGSRTVPAKRILCTLGPVSLRPEVVEELDRRGVDLFRLNLSHTPPDAVEETIAFVRRHSGTPICLDTEGAQVRCGTMTPGVVVTEGQSVRLRGSDCLGVADAFALRPASIFRELEVGTRINVDSEGAALRVTSVGADEADAIVVESGSVRSNKAVTVDPRPRLPSLTADDQAAIQVGVRLGIEHFALSFANHADDVAQLRQRLPGEAYVIAKIESRAGVQNVEGIASAADAVLIDRGDLSREVPIEHVPIYQKHLIRCANALNTPVYVATNLLESMLVSRNPTLAEANDILNTLYDGAHGLVLAAETAIGQHPIQIVEMVIRLIEAFERSTARPVLDEVAG
jgi:pyruvate kinase